MKGKICCKRARERIVRDIFFDDRELWKKYPAKKKNAEQISKESKEQCLYKTHKTAIKQFINDKKCYSLCEADILGTLRAGARGRAYNVSAFTEYAAVLAIAVISVIVSVMAMVKNEISCAQQWVIIAMLVAIGVAAIRMIICSKIKRLKNLDYEQIIEICDQIEKQKKDEESKCNSDQKKEKESKCNNVEKQEGNKDGTD